MQLSVGCSSLPGDVGDQVSCAVFDSETCIYRTEWLRISRTVEFVTTFEVKEPAPETVTMQVFVKQQGGVSSILGTAVVALAEVSKEDLVVSIEGKGEGALGEVRVRALEGSVAVNGGAAEGGASANADKIAQLAANVARASHAVQANVQQQQEQRETQQQGEHDADMEQLLATIQEHVKAETELTAFVDSLNHNVGELQAAATQREEEVNRLNDDLRAKEDALAQAQAKQADVSQIEAELDALHRQLANAKAELAKSQGDTEQARAEAVAGADALLQARKEAEGMHEALAGARDENEELRQHLAEAEASASQANAQQQQELDAALAREQEARALLASAENGLGEAQREADAQRAEAESLRKRLDTSKQLGTSYLQSMEELRERGEIAERDAQAKDEEIAELRAFLEEQQQLNSAGSPEELEQWQQRALAAEERAQALDNEIIVREKESLELEASLTSEVQRLAASLQAQEDEMLRAAERHEDEKKDLQARIDALLSVQGDEPVMQQRSMPQQDDVGVSSGYGHDDEEDEEVVEEEQEEEAKQHEDESTPDELVLDLELGCRDVMAREATNNDYDQQGQPQRECDPIAAVFVRGQDGAWSCAGQTECVRDTPDADFRDTVRIRCALPTVANEKNVRVCLYDAHTDAGGLLDDSRLVGYANLCAADLNAGERVGVPLVDADPERNDALQQRNAILLVMPHPVGSENQAADAAAAAAAAEEEAAQELLRAQEAAAAAAEERDSAQAALAQAQADLEALRAAHEDAAKKNQDYLARSLQVSQVVAELHTQAQENAAERKALNEALDTANQVVSRLRGELDQRSEKEDLSATMDATILSATQREGGVSAGSRIRIEMGVRSLCEATNPVVGVWVRNPDAKRWIPVGRSEWVVNATDVDFASFVALRHHGIDDDRQLLFCVHDSEQAAAQSQPMGFIAEAHCSVDKLLKTLGSELRLNLVNRANPGADAALRASQSKLRLRCLPWIGADPSGRQLHSQSKRVVDVPKVSAELQRLRAVNESIETSLYHKDLRLRQAEKALKTQRSTFEARFAELREHLRVLLERLQKQNKQLTETLAGEREMFAQQRATWLADNPMLRQLREQVRELTAEGERLSHREDELEEDLKDQQDQGHERELRFQELAAQLNGLVARLQRQNRELQAEIARLREEAGDGKQGMLLRSPQQPRCGQGASAPGSVAGDEAILANADSSLLHAPGATDLSRTASWRITYGTPRRAAR